jgi:hypothetical protein
MCVAVGCQNGKTSGIHVQLAGQHETKKVPVELIGESAEGAFQPSFIKAEPENANVYILPLCDFHAGCQEELEIRPMSKFVNANTKETCGEVNSGLLQGTDL